nr:hypothetical protein [uncultured Sphaerochaeta sp.]
MGIYTKYLDSLKDFPEITKERKKLLKEISDLRDGNDILTYASTFAGSIEWDDKLPFYDQLSNLGQSNKIDIILETPGGQAEVVEDFIQTLRKEYEIVNVIVPGGAMSAGTIFAMGANEILMGDMSTLGPIDAQMITNNKRFAADAFLMGLDKIKEECAASGRLNPAYIPILQQISPGEIQSCENAQSFSRSLVKEWLSKYKFESWETHSSDGRGVTEQEKIQKAEEIATNLCNHSRWLSHGRNLKISDLQAMGLKINDYSHNTALNNAITGYYALLKMSFEKTNMFKIFETPTSQIYRFAATQVINNPLPKLPGQLPPNPKQVGGMGVADMADLDIHCPSCKTLMRIQANLGVPKTLKKGYMPYPVATNKVHCPKCGTEVDIGQLRMQIEAQTRKKIV